MRSCFNLFVFPNSVLTIFYMKEEAKENERSPSVVLLCEGLLSRGMVYELGASVAGVRWFFLQPVSDI